MKKLFIKEAEEKFEEAANVEINLIKTKGVSEDKLKEAINNRIRAFCNLIKVREELEG